MKKNFSSLKYFFKFKKYYIILLILILFNAILSNASVLINKNIIDLGISRDNFNILLKYIILLIIVFSIGVILYNIIAIYRTWIIQTVLNDIRSKMFNSIIHKRKDFFENLNGGEFIHRIMNELDQIISFIFDSTINFIVSLCNIIFFIIILYYLDFYIWLIIIVFITLFILLFILFSKVFFKYENIILKEMSNTNNIIDECFNNIKTVLYLRIQIYINKKLDIQLNKNKNIICKYTKVKTYINSLLGIITFFPVIIIWIYGGKKIISFSMTIGTLIAITSYYQNLLANIQSFKTLNSEYQQFKAMVKRVDEMFVASDYENLDKRNLVTMETIDTIELKEISLKYNNIKIIDNLNMVLKKGDILYVKGNNGSGKTSLINILSGVIKPTNGEILLNGHCIEEIDLKSLRNIINIIPQEIELFSTTVKDNISLDRNINETSILNFINNIGFLGMPKSFLNIKILNRGINLSAGQRQKIAILRGLIGLGDILILDESDSSLDLHSRNKLLEYIYSIKNNHIIIIISHKEDVKFTKSLLFKNGDD